MPRPQKGGVVTYLRKDGLTTYSLRVPYGGERILVKLGTERDGYNPVRAERELEITMALIEAGKWTPPTEDRATPDADLSIAELVSMMLRDRWHELDEDTRKDYTWRASHHLLPLIGTERVTAFDEDRFAWFRRELARRAALAAEAIERRRPLVDDRGRVIKPLSARSRNMVLQLLAQALDIAVDRKLVVVNVARGKGKRFKEDEPERTFAEPEQVHALLEAADLLDGAVMPPHLSGIAERRAAGASLRDLAEEFALTGPSQAHYRLRRAESFKPQPGHRRAAIVAMAGASLRAHEICLVEVRDYDPVGADARRADVLALIHRSGRRVPSGRG